MVADLLGLRAPLTLYTKSAWYRLVHSAWIPVISLIGSCHASNMKGALPWSSHPDIRSTWIWTQCTIHIIRDLTHYPDPVRPSIQYPNPTLQVTIRPSTSTDFTSISLKFSFVPAATTRLAMWRTAHDWCCFLGEVQAYCLHIVLFLKVQPK